jgi:hypothetical protein
MDKTMQIQAQIRQNAEEVSSYLTDMKKWEKSIKNKDQKLKFSDDNKKIKKPSIRNTAGTVPIKSNSCSYYI